MDVGSFLTCVVTIALMSGRFDSTKYGKTHEIHMRVQKKTPGIVDDEILPPKHSQLTIVRHLLVARLCAKSKPFFMMLTRQQKTNANAHHATKHRRQMRFHEGGTGCHQPKGKKKRP